MSENSSLFAVPKRSLEQIVKVPVASVQLEITKISNILHFLDLHIFLGSEGQEDLFAWAMRWLYSFLAHASSAPGYAVREMHLLCPKVLEPMDVFLTSL